MNLLTSNEELRNTEKVGHGMVLYLSLIRMFIIPIKQVKFGTIYATGLCMAKSISVNTDLKINTSTFLYVSRHSEDKMLKPSITGLTLGATGLPKFTKI
jgi:hypothetical protein